MKDEEDRTPRFITCSNTLICTGFRLVLVAGWWREEKWIHTRASKSILANPIYTLEHVEEALAVRRLFPGSPFAESYAAGTVHSPPLVLALFESLHHTISTAYGRRVVLGLVLTVVDLLIAWYLEEICRFLQTKFNLSRERMIQQKIPDKLRAPLADVFGDGGVLDRATLPCLVAQFYYLNPISILASSSLNCFQSFPVLMLVVALNYACNGSIVWSSFLLSVTTYMECHNAIFLVPATLLVTRRKGVRAVVLVLSLFILISGVLQGLNCLLVGTSAYPQVVADTHGHTFSLRGLSPSLSTLWYFGMEQFHRFQDYMTILVGGAPYMLIFPLSLRLWRYPAVLIALFWYMGTLFRPPGTLYSLNVGYCVLLLSPDSLCYMRRIPMVIAAVACFIPVCLYIVTNWLWLDPGAGEANFVYFQCLAFNVFVSVPVVQFCGASMKRDKVLRYCEKQEKQLSESKAD